MLEYELWGNTLESWGISILFIIGAIVVVKLFSLFSKKVLKPFTTRTQNHLDDVIYYSLESPIKFAVMLLGIWIAIHRLVYPDNFVKIIDNAYRILIVLNITWVFARLLGGLLEIYLGKESTGQTHKMMPIIKRTVLVLIWIIALAAQDTVKNIFGAFTIFTDKPFNIGDTIRVDSFEGTVIDVGARSTKIMDYDKRIITFPNYKITDANIINISSEPMRRVVLNLGLTYGRRYG